MVQGQALKVLFLPLPGVDPLWQRHVAEALHPRHELRVLDPAAPVSPQFKDVDVVIDTGGSVGTRAMLDAAANVRLWQILGTGLDHFDMAYWRSRGVAVANCPGSMSAVALAEHALMLMLMVSRKVAESAVHLANGTLCAPTGSELAGKTLCLIGFGASARELAKRAVAMGMRVLATDIVPVERQTMTELGVEDVVDAGRLDEILAQADVVSLHLHLTAETRHTLDARRIDAMKRGAIIINVARGALVDEAALVRAVDRGHLAGAGVDVFTSEPPSSQDPILTTSGIVCTPHIAGVTAGTALRRAAAAARNVERVAEELEPFDRVDHLS